MLQDNVALVVSWNKYLMLKRILTAVFLIIFALFAIFYTNPISFMIISAIIFLYGAFEWGRLLGFSVKAQIIYLLLTIIAFAFSGSINALFILSLATFWWLLSPLLLIHFHLSQKKELTKQNPT